jgi:hypothetical protein
MANNGTLTPKQHAAIEALLSARDVKSAAVEAGVSYRALRIWLADSTAFDRAYRAARRQAVGQAIGRLQQYSAAAAGVLLQVMADARTPAAVKVQAASKVLDMTLKATELEDIAARLAALEERLNGKHPV